MLPAGALNPPPLNKVFHYLVRPLLGYAQNAADLAQIGTAIPGEERFDGPKLRQLAGGER
jgi:hypothetical protein